MCFRCSQLSPIWQTSLLTEALFLFHLISSIFALKSNVMLWNCATWLDFFSHVSQALRLQVSEGPTIIQFNRFSKFHYFSSLTYTLLSDEFLPFQNVVILSSCFCYWFLVGKCVKRAYLLQVVCAGFSLSTGLVCCSCCSNLPYLYWVSACLFCQLFREPGLKFPTKIDFSLFSVFISM